MQRRRKKRREEVEEQEKKGGKVVTLRGEAAVSEIFDMIKSRDDEDEVKTRLINSSPSRL